jgi:hypothetical protein
VGEGRCREPIERPEPRGLEAIRHAVGDVVLDRRPLLEAVGSARLVRHTVMDHSFVSYLRVSTDRQGRSGLGIEAQRAAVASYLSGFGVAPRAEFVEVESGKHSDRPELARALS